MNTRQKRYFRNKLLDWKRGILEAVKKNSELFANDNEHPVDPIDRAASETTHMTEAQTCKHQHELLTTIEDSLKRIDNDTYGYCEETGEPISLQRLQARPTATLSIEAQQLYERNRKLHYH